MNDVIFAGDPVSKIIKVQSYVQDGRIIGGHDATIEEAPYQVGISVSGYHYCGGSIIADKWILTAGHCATLPESVYKVRAGSSFSQSGGSLHQVSRVLRHDNYTVNRLQIPSNDIALFRLSEPLVMNTKRRIIKMFEKNEELEVGQSAMLTGWGTISPSETIYPSQLQVVEVPIISSQQCARHYAGIFEIGDGEICAMDPYNDKDTCQGDSGGPLIVEGRLVGVVSWGYGCAILDKPGVYTKVAYYRNWIDKTMKIYNGSSSLVAKWNLIFMALMAMLFMT